MAKTLSEILAIALEQRTEQLRDLTCRELEVLFFQLNRLRAKHEGQASFDRFYSAVFSLLEDCRDTSA